MKYSIGEFAEIVGVTVDTLRLYEKYGIINPVRDERNNYRYYDDLDVRNLLMSRWYRSLQMPLQDVASFTKYPSKDNITEKLQEIQMNLQDEINAKTMLLNRINQINADIEKIAPLLNKCRKEEVAGLYRLIQTDKNTLLQEDFIKNTVNQWMDLLPHTFYSFKMDREGIISNKNCIKYNWGLGINEENYHHLNLGIKNDNIEYIPPTTCISSIILSRDSEYLIKDTFQFMIDYILENNYTIDGDSFGRIILNEKINNTIRFYLEINIPIKL